LRVGFLQCAVKLLDVEQDNAILFIEQVKITSLADTLVIDNVKFECTNVLQVCLHPTPKCVLIKPKQLKKKLAFGPREKSLSNKFFFYRFPNFVEST
jgi:hypothetical protein